jgi:hypothetical protein
MREFRHWLRSIFTHWVSGVSGTGGIVVTFYTTYLAESPNQQVVFGILALTCLLFACFWSWRELHKKVETEEQREAKRKAIDTFIQKGNAIVQTNIRESPGIPHSSGLRHPCPPRPKDIAEVEKWVEEVDAFIVSNHPTFLGHFHNTIGVQTMNFPDKYEFESLMEKLGLRLKRLSELLLHI